MGTSAEVPEGRMTQAAPPLDPGTGLRNLYPGYFALVMATGITSTVLRLIHQPHLSAALLVIGIVCFVVLGVLYAARAVRYLPELTRDLKAPERAYAFFTFVAACCVLGVRLLADGHRPVTVALAVAAGVAWAGLSYGIPARLILGERPGPVLGGVNGTWFIWVVGTQSLAIAAAVLERGLAPSEARPAALIATLLWSVGVVLYLIVAALVLIRLLLLEVKPDDLSPPYWIAMGATAITVLAAARLLQMDTTPITIATGPMVAGLAVVLWAFGTWLVPLLVVFSVWRLRVTGGFHYAPPLWSVVFPLGMYSAASMEIGTVQHLPVVHEIGKAEAWVAVAAWAIVFIGMLHRLAVAGRSGGALRKAQI
jgi:tellurite resistance protein TehA-like permease